MKMEQTVCSKTSAYKIQTPGNYPEESIQHSEHGESLKSRMCLSPYVIWTLYRIKVTAVFHQNLHKGSKDIKILLESFAEWPFKIIHTEIKVVLQYLIIHHTELGENR